MSPLAENVRLAGVDVGRQRASQAEAPVLALLPTEP